MNLVNTITVKAAAIYHSKNIYDEIMELIIKKESPSCEDSKSRGSKSSILQPVRSSIIYPIFIKVRIAQL
tara:strand:+ start:63 stop:272 length:210 start_codon:yes stop_codon:yes gene_type:complete